MDINLPVNTNLQLALNKIAPGGLSLKLNQVLEAKVVDTQIILDSLTLKIDDKTVTAQAKLPIPLPAGQSLQLQVVKLLPTPELKVLALLTDELATAKSLPPADLPVLKLVNPAVPAAQPAKPELPQLLNGQQLTATVINLSGDKLTLQIMPAAAQPSDKPLLMTLNTQQLVASQAPRTTDSQQINPADLKPGTPITLQVTKAGDSPSFVIKTATIAPEQYIKDALKQLLPIQTPPAALLNQLQQVMPRLQANPSVAETLKHAAHEILLTLPSKTLLSDPGQVKKSVDQSGLFLESKLLALLAGKTDISLQDDFKLKLVKLIQLLNQEIGKQNQDNAPDILELLKDSLQKTQSTLAKLTLDQLHSLPKEDIPKQGWTLELPFFHDKTADSVKIEIEQDKAGQSEQAEKSWAVTITITPPGLGTIHCKVSCYDGSVNTRFWSETADTVDKINAHLDYLKAQFEKNGLTAGFMEAHQGKPVPSSSTAPVTTLLLSEKV